jgi:hypothetical protein
MCVLVRRQTIPRLKLEGKKKTEHEGVNIDIRTGLKGEKRCVWVNFFGEIVFWEIVLL